MEIFKSFFTGDTVIQSGSKLNNAGLDEVSEFWYNGMSSTGAATYNRYIFGFDHTKIRNKYSDKTIMSGSVLSHKLFMYNTGIWDKRLLGNTDIIGRQRASSFDMILSIIPSGETPFDEGVGKSLNYGSKNTDFGLTNKLLDGPASWNKRTAISNWISPGVYSGNTPTNPIIASQHFSTGAENLEMDITSTIENIISGKTPNSGFILALSGATYELMTGTTRQYFGFHSKDSNTIYVPSIITSYSGTVLDDRKNFYIDKKNRLFLYTNLGKDPVNLDKIPTQVSIYDQDDTIFSAITGTSVIQMTKGVYYCDVLVPNSGNTISDLVMWKDVWSSITINNITLPAIELDFVLKKNTNYYNFGSNSMEPETFGISYYGIKNGEKIKQGDIRKLFIIAKKEFNPEDDIIIDGLQYRLYIKQGREKIDIIPWTDVHRTFNNNYLTIDTSFLLQHEYFLQLKLKSNNTEITLNDPLNFEIVENL